MRNHAVLLIIGIALFLGGVIAVILGAMIGILILMVGFGFIAAYFANMFRVGGYEAEGAIFNGFGKGRQQSEADRRADPIQGEKNAGVWDSMTQDKE
jgi:hypothetical protein